jgi:hypothetical protein
MFFILNYSEILGLRKIIIYNFFFKSLPQNLPKYKTDSKCNFYGIACLIDYKNCLDLACENFGFLESLQPCQLDNHMVMVMVKGHR